MNYGYIRVSSDKQTVENQRYEINEFAKREGLVIDVWIEETISGTTNYSTRKLGDLLHAVEKNDLILCAELSRLGRNLFMIMDILNNCMAKGCRVWSIKDNYRLGDDIQSKVLAFAFGLSAEIERDLISQRTKEALARKKAEGKTLGRPKGSTSAKVKLSGKEDQIIALLDTGASKTEIAKLMGVHRETLARFINTRIRQKTSGDLSHPNHSLHSNPTEIRAPQASTPMTPLRQPHRTKKQCCGSQHGPY
ncbi:MAG: master DNA invertase Mpi family serine-type recombinase [Adlercreutzia sp.]|nr:master DNA invertase Mpi family serine-type recombinase [Adlercreutzia sp.]